VEADEVEPLVPLALLDRARSRAIFGGDAELGVVSAGGDRVQRVAVDPRRDAQDDFLPCP
jgi:hypothetical protein